MIVYVFLDHYVVFYHLLHDKTYEQSVTYLTPEYVLHDVVIVVHAVLNCSHVGIRVIIAQSVINIGTLAYSQVIREHHG